MRRRTARKKSAHRAASLVSLGAAPARRGSGWVIVVLGALVLVNLYVFVWNKETSVSAIKEKAVSQPPAAALPSQPLLAPGTLPGAGSGVAAPVGPPATIDGVVAKNDTLGRLLKNSGLAAGEADEVIRSLSGVLDFRSIRAGQPFKIERGPDGRVARFELTVSKVQTVRATRGGEGGLIGLADNSETHTEVKSLGGKIDSSLYQAIKSAGETPALVDFFVDVFAYDLDFYNDTHEGDTFRVVVEKQFTAEDKQFIRYTRILAAEYQGKAGTFRTFWFVAPGAKAGGYFNVDGQSSEKSLLKTPLKFQRISSGFDRRRMHPVLHTARAHLGIDYAAPTGTPVWAAQSGTIVSRGPAGGAGNMVIIRHDGGIDTVYMHLNKFADGHKVGQRVAAKTVIGYVGTTGLSTGPHLHFGVRQNGAYIDPSKLVPMRGKGVGRAELAAFKAEAARLQALMTQVTI